jgi:hypothetical protein
MPAMVSIDHFRQELLSQMGRAVKSGDILNLDRTNGAGMTVRYLLPRAK